MRAPAWLELDDAETGSARRVLVTLAAESARHAGDPWGEYVEGVRLAIREDVIGSPTAAAQVIRLADFRGPTLKTRERLSRSPAPK